jgi:hypothetical protein
MAWLAGYGLRTGLLVLIFLFCIFETSGAHAVLLNKTAIFIVGAKYYICHNQE